MPYMHKVKWGAVDALQRKVLHMDSHLYSAAVAPVREGPPDSHDLAFWRSKTRCSSYSEWMELHDAQDGACLWRAEARYADRAAPVSTVDARGREKVEFLTVVRLYLEAETAPRLMLVHRDRQPDGFNNSECSKTVGVYMLDPNAAGYKPPAVPGAPPASSVAPTAEELVESFDFASLPPASDIFQITLNSSLTTVSLAAMRLPGTEELDSALSSKRGLELRKNDVRTLARLKRLPGTQESMRVEVDAGLDLPLVMMLLAATDQLLLSHEAINYDVEWPPDYEYANLECFSRRKTQAEQLKTTAEYGMQTGEIGESHKMERGCFGFF